MIQARWPFAHALTCALLVGQAGNAGAQPSTPKPQQTSAVYEDWIVRCETKPSPPAQKICEMVQFTQLKGQAGVLTQIVIGHPVKGQPYRIAIQVPISMWLPTGVRLSAGGKDEGIVAQFMWCVPTACFAVVETKDDIIKKFRSATEAGKLQFKDANQRDIALPVSFKGFGTAYDALMKE